MESAGDDSDILLTVAHPNSMEVLAWAREYGKSRIFCFQSGHDDVTYSNPNFREVLKRGIQWTGRMNNEASVRFTSPLRNAYCTRPSRRSL